MGSVLSGDKARGGVSSPGDGISGDHARGGVSSPADVTRGGACLSTTAGGGVGRRAPRGGAGAATGRGITGGEMLSVTKLRVGDLGFAGEGSEGGGGHAKGEPGEVKSVSFA